MVSVVFADNLLKFKVIQDMEQVGKKLKNLRLQRGLTTRQLAKALQTSQAQISRIENGLRQPSGDLIIKAADFFNVSLDKLMRDELELD
jgi:transcriptional regulator with XRE-family HTH domain